MPFDSVHLLPLSVFVLLPSTFIVTYIIAICLRHVEVEFPYISDTGTHTPESCIFSQALNIVSFLVFLTVYVRYKQIEQHYRDLLTPDSRQNLSTNWYSMCLGFISAFGLSVVANFQETNVFRVHMIGAMLAFGFGVMYAWSQTYMSFKMVPLVNSKSMAYCRLFLSILMTCTFTTSSICGPMAFRRFNGKDPTNWRPWDGGWHLHIISTCCEWVSAMSLDFFILSFVREMHMISLSSPRVIFDIRSIILQNQDPSWPGAPGIDTEVSIRSNNGIRQVNRIDPSTSDANFTTVSGLSDSYNQSIIG